MGADSERRPAVSLPGLFRLHGRVSLEPDSLEVRTVARSRAAMLQG